jgi:sugar-specific transcriptional regulator TrmB
LTLKLLLDALKGFGLNHSEAKIYICLAKKGSHNAKEICNELSLTKQQVYLCLDNLQNRGIIYATLQHSASFHALPFEKVLDMYTRSILDEAKSAQRNKAELLKRWQSLISDQP